MKRLLLMFVFLPACIFAEDEAPRAATPIVRYDGQVVDLNEVKLLANAKITLMLRAKQVRVQGALSQYQNGQLSLQTKEMAVTIEADDTTWTVDVVKNAKTQTYHYCGDQSFYLTGQPIEFGLKLIDGDTPVLGPVPTPVYFGGNLDTEPVAQQNGRRLVFEAFERPENGTLVIDEVFFDLLVVQRPSIERIEATRQSDDLHAVRFFGPNAQLCHTPAELQTDGCELVFAPTRHLNSHTFRKTKKTCQLSINGDVVGSF